MNTFNFTDVYDVLFGADTKIKQYPDPDATDFEIDFVTPSHTEEDVRFSVSTMEYVFHRDNIKLDIMDGDTVLYTSNRSFSMFVNLDGVDPKAGRPSGHPNVSPITRKEHLLPSHKYTLRVHSVHKPISITYSGTNINEVELGTGMGGSIEMTLAGVAGMFVPND